MRKLGSLQCLETHPRVEPKEGQQPLIFILFHGYGADAYDLQALSEVIQTPAPTHFLFPQGVLEVPIGPGWTGRAWWQIDIMALQQAAQQGTPRDLTKEKPAGLAELRKKIFAAIEQLKVPWNQIILGGFSQGAMLATHIFLHAPENPRALVSLSGALLDKEDLKGVAANRAGLPFFASHGRADGVLDARGSAQLETFLISAGLKGKLYTFPGAHEISPDVIQKLNEFLQQVAK
jgi:phospholipase/carboxylesterase